MSITSIRVRTRRSGETTFVELNISHPMESGHRRDSLNQTIPSWYLTEMTVFHNDARITSVKLGPLVSRNPAVTLALKNARADDLLKITWLDSRGETGEQLARVS